MSMTPSSHRMPVYFISHGGGPWPWVEGMREMFALTERELAALPAHLPVRPKAVLMISGHWEDSEFCVSSAAQPGMEYDYFGFPPHTYQIRYPAPGSPALAQRVQELLGAAGLPCRADAHRGLDHGAFVPMHCMYPQADMPLVLLSLKKGYDPQEHFRAGQALSALRDEGVLIMGSGLTYHDMRGFGSEAATPVAQAFEQFLARVVADPAHRREQLLAWTQGPQARRAHPREDHLIPLMVAAGAAERDPGRRLFLDHALKVDMGSYEFG
jgi:aromatic ring-opening dioxygenase catalytic subunit (LigB family)